jgi:hypothetical protein
VQLRVLANNGADVYVNGQPALSNAAADAPAFYYNNVVSLDPNLLVAGPNIIAAKVGFGGAARRPQFARDCVRPLVCLCLRSQPVVPLPCTARV